MRSSSAAPRPASRLSASLALAAVFLAANALADTYTVYAELHPPYRANRVAVQKLLKQEGYEAHAEGDREVALVISASQLMTLFGARVIYRKAEASARPGMTEQAYLESVTMPPRLAKYVRRVYLDPQRG